MLHDADLRDSLVDSTAELLNTDLELSLTMLRLAAGAARGSDKWRRNLARARKGYADVSRAVAIVKEKPVLLEALTRKLEHLYEMIVQVEQGEDTEPD